MSAQLNKSDFWGVPYVPQPLPRDQIYEIKIHSINYVNFTCDVELFKGGESISRSFVNQIKYKELEKKVYQSQKLH